MKNIILIAIAVFGMSAAAGVDYQWCQDAGLFIGDEANCERIVQDGFFQQGVDHTCMQASFSGDKVTCIRGAKNKEYTRDELKFCADQPISDDVAECMERSGRSFVDPSLSAERRLLRIENVANRALDSLERGRIGEALLLIGEILILATNR